MFERFFSAVRTFLRWSSPVPTNFESLAADQQVKAELLSAVEAGMVTTRLQDHTLPGDRSPKNPEAATLRNLSRKRERDEGFQNTHKQSSAKRKRSSSKLEAVVTDDTTIVAAEPEVLKENNPTRMALEAEEPYYRGNGLNDAEARDGPEKVADAVVLETQQIPIRLTSTLEPNISNKPKLSIGANVAQKAKDGERVMSDRDKEVANKMVSRAQGRNSKRRKAIPNPGKPTKTTTHHTNGVGEAKNGVVLKLPTHKRFGSEEPEIIEETSVAQANEVNANPSGLHHMAVEDESEDEAPEAITATVGLEQSRTAAIGVARAIERQEKATKEKRQIRDARLKEQVQLAKEKRRRHKDVSPENQPDAITTDTLLGSHAATNGRKLDINSPLPLFLPDEILAVEPVARLPTLPPDLLASKPQKHRFLEREPKHPKDVKHGPITFRVLKDNSSTLPPKVSKSSKSLREYWLSGQRGPRGNMELERRKISMGFVRKRAG